MHINYKYQNVIVLVEVKFMMTSFQNISKPLQLTTFWEHRLNDLILLYLCQEKHFKNLGETQTILKVHEIQLSISVI